MFAADPAILGPALNRSAPQPPGAMFMPAPALFVTSILCGFFLYHILALARLPTVSFCTLFDPSLLWESCSKLSSPVFGRPRSGAGRPVAPRRPLARPRRRVRCRWLWESCPPFLLFCWLASDVPWLLIGIGSRRCCSGCGQEGSFSSQTEALHFLKALRCTPGVKLRLVSRGTGNPDGILGWEFRWSLPSTTPAPSFLDRIFIPKAFLK